MPLVSVSWQKKIEITTTKNAHALSVCGTVTRQRFANKHSTSATGDNGISVCTAVKWFRASVKNLTYAHNIFKKKVHIKKKPFRHTEETIQRYQTSYSLVRVTVILMEALKFHM